MRTEPHRESWVSEPECVEMRTDPHREFRVSEPGCVTVVIVVVVTLWCSAVPLGHLGSQRYRREYSAVPLGHLGSQWYRHCDRRRRRRLLLLLLLSSLLLLLLLLAPEGWGRGL